jgi:Serine hydroxymethyltransferase
LLLISL